MLVQGKIYLNLTEFKYVLYFKICKFATVTLNP